MVGAPRGGANRAGEVFILESFTPSDKGKEKLVVRQKLSGNQMGEFFGGCLASVDLNGDGLEVGHYISILLLYYYIITILEDLVVGSPLATYEEVRKKRSASKGKYLKVSLNN